MKHVRSNELKSCIYKPWDQFSLDVRAALNDEEAIVYLDGTILSNALCEPFEALSKYYEVSEITSIHADNTEYVGIWICYND